MIQVLVRAVGILELLGNNPDKEYPLTLIASTLDIDKGTCFNILKTLCSQGIVQQDGPRSGYKLGYKLYNLTGRHVENEELTKFAREDIETLGNALNETVLLSVIRNDKRIVLYNTVPDREIIVSTRTDKSIYSACTGRAILANYTPAHLEKALIRLGLPTRAEWPEIYESDNVHGELVNSLMFIKNKGYAKHVDANGIAGFSAPIFRAGHVVGSVGVYLPVFRLSDENYYLQSTLECAKKINEKLSLLKS